MGTALLSTFLNLSSGATGLIIPLVSKGIKGIFKGVTETLTYRRHMATLKIKADIKYYPSLLKDVEEVRNFKSVWLKFDQLIVSLLIMCTLTLPIFLGAFFHIPVTIEYEYMGSILGFPTHTTIGWYKVDGFPIPLYLQELGFFCAGMLFGTRFK